MTKLEQTSVPSWALKPLIMNAPETGSHAAVLSFADDGAAPGAWLEQLDRAGIEHRTLRIIEAEATTERIALTVNELLSAAQVGFRLLIFGPLPEVLRARSAALEAGLLDEEISIGTTCVRHLPLFCVHCFTETLVDATIEDVVPCPGCGAQLLVYYHLSRRAGSFLGFKNDAEAWEPSAEQRGPAMQEAG